MSNGHNTLLPSLEDLLKFKHENLQEFATRAQDLARASAKLGRVYTVFRIAKELQDINYEISDVEDLIINTHNSYFICKFAREIKKASIVKLQEAIINIGNLEYIAKFSCYINGADSNKLENIIINSNNARAAYICLKSANCLNINKFQNILLKTKKPRYLYRVAQLTTDSDLVQNIQNLIINSSSMMYIRLFAANIPGVDTRIFENKVIKSGSIAEMLKFSKVVPSDKINKLLMLGLY